PDDRRDRDDDADDRAADRAERTEGAAEAADEVRDRAGQSQQAADQGDDPQRVGPRRSRDGRGSEAAASVRRSEARWVPVDAQSSPPTPTAGGFFVVVPLARSALTNENMKSAPLVQAVVVLAPSAPEGGAAALELRA